MISTPPPLAHLLSDRPPSFPHTHSEVFSHLLDGDVAPALDVDNVRLAVALLAVDLERDEVGQQRINRRRLKRDWKLEGDNVCDGHGRCCRGGEGEGLRWSARQDEPEASEG